MSVVCFRRRRSWLDKKSDTKFSWLSAEFGNAIRGTNTTLIFYRAFQTRLVHASSNLSQGPRRPGRAGVPRRRQRPLHSGTYLPRRERATRGRRFVSFLLIRPLFPDG
ncbi:hypothetical protein TcasGA2_TC008932 [Tribolium castaneum]|uniref:Uncharacterized protein n=1 Tax=Tribolium castaneum TaxID=7070 RepID=D6WQC6_TRICA|nr:hypothetical protein TcasGA2_TC008932 [Tribolium castaneum]